MSLEFYKEKNFKKVEASGVVFEIPEEWKIVRLGEYIKYTKGRKPEVMISDRKIGYLPYLSTEYLRNSNADNFVKITGNEVLVSKGEIILLWDGSNAGEVFLGKEGVLSSTMVKVELLRHDYDVLFLFYLLKSKESFLKSQTKGTGIPHVDKNVFRNLSVVLPPLEEQRKIAHVLTTIDKAIEEVDKAIKKAEKIKKGLMQELLTKGIGHKEFKDTEIGKIPKEWKVVKLGEIAKLESGGTPSRQKLEYWKRGTIPWIKSGELNDTLIYDSEEKITELGLKNSSAKIFPKGTLLIALYGATVGKTGILSIEASTNQAVCAILPAFPNTFDSKFLQYCLILLREKLIAQSSGGAQSNIYLYVLKNFKIPLPPLEEQKKIAEILSKWDRVIELKKAKKEKLERMKKKVMELLLTGKVRVK